MDARGAGLSRTRRFHGIRGLGFTPHQTEGKVETVGGGGVPKIRGSFLAYLYKDHSIVGSILGSAYFGKTTIKAFRLQGLQGSGAKENGSYYPKPKSLVSLCMAEGRECKNGKNWYLLYH